MIADRFPKLGNSTEFTLAKTYKNRLPVEQRKKFVNDYIEQILILFNNNLDYFDDIKIKTEALIKELQNL